MQIAVRGRQGKVKVGYQTVATLTAFSLAPVAPGSTQWQIEGTASGVDAFWLTQGPPFTLDVQVGQQRWIWREAALVVADGIVRGTVTGRPERR